VPKEILSQFHYFENGTFTSFPFPQISMSIRESCKKGSFPNIDILLSSFYPFWHFNFTIKHYHFIIKIPLSFRLLFSAFTAASAFHLLALLLRHFQSPSFWRCRFIGGGRFILIFKGQQQRLRCRGHCPLSLLLSGPSTPNRIVGGFPPISFRLCRPAASSPAAPKDRHLLPQRLVREQRKHRR
jgi:hypothetical protein